MFLQGKKETAKTPAEIWPAKQLQAVVRNWRPENGSICSFCHLYKILGCPHLGKEPPSQGYCPQFAYGEGVTCQDLQDKIVADMEQHVRPVELAPEEVCTAA